MNWFRRGGEGNGVPGPEGESKEELVGPQADEREVVLVDAPKLKDGDPVWYAFLPGEELPLTLDSNTENAARDAFRGFARKHEDRLGELDGLTLTEARVKMAEIQGAE